MQERMRSYLLGTMPEEARLQLEEEFFESHEVYGGLQDSINDLLDEYARGDLDEDERRLIEVRLLESPRNRVRLKLARALAEREKRERVQLPQEIVRRPRLRPALIVRIAGIAACLCAAIWFGADNLRVRRELVASRKSAMVAVNRPDVVSLTLHPQLVRGRESTMSIAAPDRKALLRVELATDEIFPSYSIEIEAGNRGRIWTRSALPRETNGTVAVWLPGEVVTPGAYEFLLYGERGGGRELLGSYLCRIVAAKGGESPISTKPAQ